MFKPEKGRSGGVSPTLVAGDGARNPDAELGRMKAGVDEVVDAAEKAVRRLAQTTGPQHLIAAKI